MLRYYSAILVICFFLVECTPINIYKISRVLGQKQNDKTGRLKQNTFYEIRKKLFNKYPTIFSGQIKAIFFLEKYDIEEASYYSMIWTKNDTVSYSCFANELIIRDKIYFTTKTINWISIWDTTAIRKEEKKYPSSQKNVYAARVLLVDNKCLVDILKMKEFILDR